MTLIEVAGGGRARFDQERAAVRGASRWTTFRTLGDAAFVGGPVLFVRTSGRDVGHGRLSGWWTPPFLAHHPDAHPSLARSR